MRRLIAVLAFILIFSLIANVIFFLVYVNNTESNFEQEIKKYPYLSKRILQEEMNDILINFLPLRQDLRDLVKPFEDSFAFYFEYLPTGTSIGINEKAEFTALSLFKVPVVMAYYHQKERLGLKEDPIVTIKENEADKEFGDLWMKVGTKISLGEAARLTLVESDNTASLILADNTAKQDFDEVYEGLDIDLVFYSDQVTLTAKHYSSILKALYFSSVLTKENSQKILELLTQTKFNDKLPAGVPKGIPVAHKIGVYADALFQDCGIVYVPKRPYLLCMVSHSNEDLTRERMKLVSATIYEYVSQTNT